MMLFAAAFAISGWRIEIPDERINESSGLAASHIAQGVFYTHNDSGDAPRIFRFRKDGKAQAIDVPGAIATDWESMESAVVDGQSYLYLCDVGDNARQREFVTIYKVPEPGLNDTRTTEPVAIEIEYETPHDAEGVFVHPQTGDIWIVTKAREGYTLVYRLPDPEAGRHKIEPLGRIPVNTGGGPGGLFVTGAACSPDGRAVVLRTYTGALEYAVEGEFSDWWNQEPRSIAMPTEKQAEAICYSKDGSILITSSEGTPCPITFTRR